MPSPFPGMDPYLEQEWIWHDFHGHLLGRLVAAITPQIVPQYVCRYANPAKWDMGTERTPFLEIRDLHNREVITVIDLLTPANKKAGPEREESLRKRKAAKANFVEIDLLRGGIRSPWEGIAKGDYCVSIGRAPHEFPVESTVWGVRDRFPAFLRIPLRVTDPDIRLGLKAPFDQVFDAAGYAHDIYGGQPELALNDKDAAWAKALADSVR